MINEYLDWTVLEKVCTLMHEAIPEINVEIKKETNLSDIGFDTYGMDNLRPLLEEKFSILISNSELDSFKTVADIIKFVRNRSKKL